MDEDPANDAMTIERLRAEIDALRAERDRISKHADRLEAKNERLAFQVKRLAYIVYGRKSEKLSREELGLLAMCGVIRRVEVQRHAANASPSMSRQTKGRVGDRA